MPHTPVNVYLAYAHADEDLLLRLRAQLTAVERIGMVDAFHDAEIEAGVDREEAMLHALQTSPIILLLISADFFASEFAYEKEMKMALQLQAAGKAKVLPVILRECTWEYTPLAKLHVLPEKGIPVTNKHWQTVDNAFDKVVEVVAKLALKIQNPLEAAELETPVAKIKEPIQQTNKTEIVISEEESPSFPTIMLNGLEWMVNDLKVSAKEGTMVENEPGNFYDFKAALSSCPSGWRLPTKAEWEMLTEDQIDQLQLSVKGIYDRGGRIFKDQKSFYWSSEQSHGNESWCYERLKGKPGRIDSRYTHWAMNCRLIKE